MDDLAPFILIAAVVSWAVSIVMATKYAPSKSDGFVLGLLFGPLGIIAALLCAIRDELARRDTAMARAPVAPMAHPHHVPDKPAGRFKNWDPS